MAIKVKVSSPAAPPSLSQTPPWTMEERLQRIEVMGQRIDSYVRFMCSVANMNGSSAEVKDRAVTAFYERMVVVEGELGRIHEALRLE
jgi:hypothetical protein